MTHKRNFTKIVGLAKQKSEEKKKHVIDVITQMISYNEVINFPRVQNKAKVSKSYLYDISEIRTLIENARSEQNCTEVSERGNEEITQLRAQIKQLEKELDHWKKDELWKVRYERLLSENRELKKQLENAYHF